MIVISKWQLISSQAFFTWYLPLQKHHKFFACNVSPKHPRCSMSAFLAVPKQILHFPLDAVSAQILPLRAWLLWQIFVLEDRCSTPYRGSGSCSTHCLGAGGMLGIPSEAAPAPNPPPVPGLISSRSYHSCK